MLEKLLLSDITTATCAYSAKRQSERQKVKDRVISNTPPEVRALVDERANAEKTVQRAIEGLRERGYSFGGYPAALFVNDYGKQPQELTDFDGETKRIEARMTELKRDYTLRLQQSGSWPTSNHAGRRAPG